LTGGGEPPVPHEPTACFDGDASLLDQAREVLHRADEAYRGSRRRLADSAARVREITVGEILDGSLEFVRRHPLAGLAAVGVLAFLAGRATRR
jgi:hypothetical protein